MFSRFRFVSLFILLINLAFASYELRPVLTKHFGDSVISFESYDLTSEKIYICRTASQIFLLQGDFSERVLSISNSENLKFVASGDSLLAIRASSLIS